MFKKEAISIEIYEFINAYSIMIYFIFYYNSTNQFHVYINSSTHNSISNRTMEFLNQDNDKLIKYL